MRAPPEPRVCGVAYEVVAQVQVLQPAPKPVTHPTQNTQDRSQNVIQQESGARSRGGCSSPGTLPQHVC
eukprot:1673256-Rhodomonas_salina.2